MFLVFGISSSGLPLKAEEARPDLTQIARFWEFAERSPVCLVGDTTPPRDQRLMSEPPGIVFDRRPPPPGVGVAPFRAGAGLACGVTANTAVPRPIASPQLTGPAPGQDRPIDLAARQIRFNELAAIANPGREAAEPLIETLTSWAATDALRGGPAVREDGVSYPVFAALIPAAIGYGAVRQYMTPREIAFVHPWLADRMESVVNTTWTNRQDNKLYFVAAGGMAWGLITGEQQAVDYAIGVYRQAIADMRPDGSFPVDATRGGSGLRYNDHSTAALVLIAAMAELQGQDLFGFDVDGRSIHDAVSRTLYGIEDPVGTNRTYARSCPNDSFGSILQPVPHWRNGRGENSLSFLRLYAYNNPGHPNVDRIRALVPHAMSDVALIQEPLGVIGCGFTG